MTLEIVEQVPDLDALVIAIGGGSQAVGALTVARTLAPQLEVLGVQAAGAPAIHDSWHAGKRLTTERADTFAEGVATRTTYDLTFDALAAGLSDFVTVTDAEIAESLRTIVSITKNVVEGAGAMGFASLPKFSERLAGKKVGIVFCGGNIDSAVLRRVLNPRRSLLYGRMPQVRTSSASRQEEAAVPRLGALAEERSLGCRRRRAAGPGASARYFKTGVGEYGEGDKFLGLNAAQMKALAREARGLSLEDTLKLLHSRWHEERSVALLILVGPSESGFGALIANTGPRRHVGARSSARGRGWTGRNSSGRLEVDRSGSAASQWSRRIRRRGARMPACAADRRAVARRSARSDAQGGRLDVTRGRQA